MEKINQFTRVGTFCEKCRNPFCICKIGENSHLNDHLAQQIGKAKLDDDDDLDDDDSRWDGCDFCHDPHCAGSCQDDNDF